MFKKVYPAREKVMPNIGQFPHCDQRVLHAPGECEYCDKHAVWQALRIAWGIAFTGYEPEGKELPDPATAARGLKSIESWHGNVPKKKDEGYDKFMMPDSYDPPLPNASDTVIDFTKPPELRSFDDIAADLSYGLPKVRP